MNARALGLNVNELWSGSRFMSLLYELCNRPIFFAKLPDTPFEMAYAMDGTEDQPRAEHDQTEVQSISGSSRGITVLQVQ